MELTSRMIDALRFVRDHPINATEPFSKDAKSEADTHIALISGQRRRALTNEEYHALAGLLVENPSGSPKIILSERGYRNLEERGFVSGGSRPHIADPGTS